jgi:hypothetical protein
MRFCVTSRGASVKKAQEYRQHAAECRAMARTAQNPEQRAQLISMAETWERLAEEREKELGGRLTR